MEGQANVTLTAPGSTIESLNASLLTGHLTWTSVNLAASFSGVSSKGVSDRVSWFVFENNTYLVTDRSAATTFQSNDQLIKLTGVLDLSASSLDSVTSVLTL